MICISYFIFFFSSRRRHTRFDCDWSSDVCSSDLEQSLFGRVPTDTAAAEFRRWLRTKSVLTVLPLPWWSLQHDTTSILEVMRRCDSAVRTRPPGQTWWAQHGARAARAYLALARHDSAEALA